MWQMGSLGFPYPAAHCPGHLCPVKSSAQTIRFQVLDEPTLRSPSCNRETLEDVKWRLCVLECHPDITGEKKKIAKEQGWMKQEDNLGGTAVSQRETMVAPYGVVTAELRERQRDRDRETFRESCKEELAGFRTWSPTKLHWRVERSLGETEINVQN